MRKFTASVHRTVRSLFFTQRSQAISGCGGTEPERQRGLGPGRRVLGGLSFAVLALAVGCADGPLIMELAEWNPYLRRKWAEDERFGPTYYTRVDEFRALRENAAQLTNDQQDHLANQLAEVLQRDENPLMRREAVRTLGALSTPTAADPMREAISDSDSAVRVAACQAWGERGGPEAVAILSGVAGQDAQADVQMAAVEQLGNFAHNRVAIDALAAALDSPDPAMQFRAIQSLKRTTDRDYGNHVAAWREYLQGGEPTPRTPSLVERLTNWF